MWWISFLSTVVVSTTHAFSIAPTPSPQPIEKVAIIGCGIAGLSLAHSLENSEECSKVYTDAASKDAVNLEAHIFDSRPSLNYGAGAGIQLTGGMCRQI